MRRATQIEHLGETPPTPRARRMARRQVAAERDEILAGHSCEHMTVDEGLDFLTTREAHIAALLGEECATWLWAYCWRSGRMRRAAGYGARVWPLLPLVVAALVGGAGLMPALLVVAAAACASALYILCAPVSCCLGHPHHSLERAVCSCEGLTYALRRCVGLVPVQSLRQLGITFSEPLGNTDEDLRRIFDALAGECEVTVGELHRTCLALMALPETRGGPAASDVVSGGPR